MGYYMRFIVEDDQPLSLVDLDAALKAADPDYSIRDGELHYSNGLYAEIEINTRGEELCDAELQELQEVVEDADVGQQQRVIEALRVARHIVALRVLSQGRDSESTLEKFDPLWEWLFTYRRGLLQADGEGFYDSDGLVLETG